MLNKKGMTLVESLLAFNIFISVVVLFVSLFHTIYIHEIKIDDHYQEILDKEESILYQNDFYTLIEEVLH